MRTKVNYLEIRVIYKEEVKEKLKNNYNIETITKTRKNMKNKQYNIY